MQKGRTRRRAPIVVLGTLLALSVGAGAFELIELLIQVNLNPGELYQVSYPGLANTGFTIRGVDTSFLTLAGRSTYDGDAGLQPSETVQEGFVLLDGTLSLDVSAQTSDGVRALTRTTYRLDIRRPELRPEQIGRALIRQGVVRDAVRARTRARAMRLSDARVMRLVEGREERPPHWVRAVRALRTARPLSFKPRTAPDGVLGHFGTAVSDAGEPYVWAVMDRNSRYAVGLTVDRDNDGVPNAADNCIGSVNSNQSDVDGDGAGDACDLDDDDDRVADSSDNCPLIANAGQLDFDLDGTGDACDFDDDNDAVSDGADRCLATAIGDLVDATGCSIADRCPCQGDWRNHGAYVLCVARTSGLFAKAGLMTQGQKDEIVSAAARSSCGF